MKNPHEIEATRPASYWNQQMKIDYQDLFINLGKLGLSLYAGAIPVAGKHALDLIKSVRPESDSKGELVYKLVLTALLDATAEFMEENRSHFELKSKQSDDDFIKSKQFKGFQKKLKKFFEEQEITMTSKELKSPRLFGFLSAYQTLLVDFLVVFGLGKKQAESVSHRFPSYFVLSFSKEFASNRGQYASLDEYLTTLTSEAVDRELAWEGYGNWLEKQANERVFDESFGLRQIYINIRAYCWETEVIERVTKDGKRKKHEIEKKMAFWLHEELNDWVKSLGTDVSHIRLVSGGPGAGKSSFAKIWAANIFHELGNRVLFIPLHHYDVDGDMFSELSKYFSENDFLKKEVMNGELFNELEKPLVLIFDGLDELSILGKSGEESANQFCNEVIRQVYRINQMRCKVKVVITGRELTIQTHKSHFRKARQVLHLLPYSVDFSTDEAFRLHGNGNDAQQKLLGIDQRHLWWRTFSSLITEVELGKIPSNLFWGEIGEVTSQPLLNYLVALGYRRGTLDIDNSLNLNEIYSGLLKGVYDRAYEYGRIHNVIDHLSFKDFARVLEEIAVSAWHSGDVRVTTVTEIEERLENQRLAHVLEKFSRKAETGVIRLLTAFYFRESKQHQRTGDRTFEFTHTSFGEFLVAKRIVGAVRVLTVKLVNDQNEYEDVFDEIRYLEAWLKLTGGAPLNSYIIDFMREELLLEVGREKQVEKWHDCICSLIGYLFRNGFPVSGVQRQNFSLETKRVRNAEEALWVMRALLAETAGESSQIEWNTQTDLKDVFLRLNVHKKSDSPRLFYQYFTQLKVVGQNVVAFDGIKVNFSHSTFKKCNFRFSIFSRSVLSNTVFTDCDMSQAIFKNCDMSEINITDIDLTRSKLFDSDLKNSKFKNVNMRGANFTGSNLQESEWS